MRKSMEKIYHRLMKEGISPNQLYLLWCLREGISPGMINYHLECRGLVGVWLDDGKPTGRALSLLIDIDENFRKSQAKVDTELMGADAKMKIEKYRLIFPEIRLPSGKYARDAVKNLEVNFRWFFRTHDYDWDTILKATEKYVQEYRSKDWAFMRTSKYFIKKQEKDGSVTSDLANYCDMIRTGEGDREQDNFRFEEKVT